MKFSYVNRIRVISIFIFLFALLLIGRLYMLQVAYSDVYQEKADRQYSTTAKSIFSRGTIYFSDKDGSLISAATLKSGVTVTVNPEILKDPEAVYQKLNAILPVDHDTFIAKATKPNDIYEEISKRVDTDIGQKIDDLKITGLKVFKERWRFYPGGSEASHVVGIMGFQGDDYAGRYGLERQYEPILKRDENAYVNFFAQIFAGLKSATASTTESEADIVTTIEPTVESYLQAMLASTSEKWDPDLIGGIIINPGTGEIYAMDTYPTFDPNNPGAQKNVAIFSNPLVENVYEMGSIIKPLTISAGIDTGVITANSTYYDKGYVIINNKKISNFDGKERGIQNMQDVLSQSLNVGAAHVESLLGNQRFADYMFGFGLGEKTGIELPSEGRSIVDNLKSKVDVNYATASFGQGIALTPVATVRALSTFAHGGMLINPHVVKSIHYKIGVSSNTAVATARRVLKRETTEEVSRMLTYSVDNVLYNGELKLPNYSVAAKTGTAQIAKNGVYTDQVLHSFVGYFPSYNPKFLILLYMVNPHGARYGSETLTVPFMNTVKFLVNYYDVPPDR